MMGTSPLNFLECTGPELHGARQGYLLLMAVGNKRGFGRRKIIYFGTWHGMISGAN